MVARIITGKSIRGILHYNENKVEQKEAHLILASGFAIDIEAIGMEQKLRRFEQRTILNTAVKTNAVHISLNFDSEDQLDDRKMQQIAADYMERIGFGEQPYLVYRHSDAAHTHVHIATTNIQADGNRIDMHNIGRDKSEPARKDIEREYKLVVAEGREASNTIGIRPADIEKAIYGKHLSKRAITNIVNAVARTYKFTSISEFNAALKQFNVTADRGSEETEMFRKKGLIYSLLDSNGNKIGIPIKASAIYRKPTLANLESKFQRNLEKRKPYRDDLKQRIDRVLLKYESVTPATLEAELKRQGIYLLLRKNTEGFIYGATFVDNKHRTVFNGSQLGKAYSARAIAGKLGNLDKAKVYLKHEQQTAYLKPKEESLSILDKSGGTDYLSASLPETSLLRNLLGTPQMDQQPTVRKRRKKKKRSGQSL